MTTSDPLKMVLDAAGIEATVLDAETVGALADALGFDPATSDDFVRTLALAADWDGETAPDGEFELRIGTWRLDLTKSGIRATVMAAILSATMVATDTREIGVALLTAIIPSILDIENVALSDGDEKLLFEVRRLPDVTDRLVTVDDLYDRLPTEIRDRLNRYDFADFIERVRGAEQAFGDADRVRIRRPDEDIPTITWR